MPKLEDLPHETVADAVARAVVDSVGRGGDTETIVARALATVRSNLGLQAGPGGGSNGSAVRPAPTSARPTPPRAPAVGNGSGGRSVVTEADVLAAARAGQGELRIARRAIVTALARDVARDTGLVLVEEA